MEVRCLRLELKLVSARSPMIKIDKKKDIENATVQKSTCQSTEGHSATQNGQEAAESFIATVSVQYRIQSPVARLTATSLTMRLY